MATTYDSPTWNRGKPEVSPDDVRTLESGNELPADAKQPTLIEEFRARNPETSAKMQDLDIARVMYNDGFGKVDDQGKPVEDFGAFARRAGVEVGGAMSNAAGIADTLTFGFGPHIRAGMETAVETVRGRGGMDAETYRRNLQRARDYDAVARNTGTVKLGTPEIPLRTPDIPIPFTGKKLEGWDFGTIPASPELEVGVPYLAGEVLGNVVQSTTLPVQKAVDSVGFLRWLASKGKTANEAVRQSVLGAGQGAGHAVSDDMTDDSKNLGDVVLDAGKGAVIGAGTGAAGTYLGRGIERGISAVTQRLGGFGQALWEAAGVQAEMPRAKATASNAKISGSNKHWGGKGDSPLLRGQKLDDTFYTELIQGPGFNVNVAQQELAAILTKDPARVGYRAVDKFLQDTGVTLTEPAEMYLRTGTVPVGPRSDAILQAARDEIMALPDHIRNVVAMKGFLSRGEGGKVAGALDNTIAELRKGGAAGNEAADQFIRDLYLRVFRTKLYDQPDYGAIGVAVRRDLPDRAVDPIMRANRGVQESVDQLAENIRAFRPELDQFYKIGDDGRAVASDRLRALGARDFEQLKRDTAMAAKEVLGARTHGLSPGGALSAYEQHFAGHAVPTDFNTGQALKVPTTGIGSWLNRGWWEGKGGGQGMVSPGVGYGAGAYHGAKSLLERATSLGLKGAGKVSWLLENPPAHVNDVIRMKFPDVAANLDNAFKQSPSVWRAATFKALSDPTIRRALMGEEDEPSMGVSP